jgi:hypothetical protein
MQARWHSFAWYAQVPLTLMAGQVFVPAPVVEIQDAAAQPIDVAVHVRLAIDQVR